MYQDEKIETIPAGERRVRDNRLCPKRRATDEPEPEPEKPTCRKNPDYISARELELLVKIDEHIDRIMAERRS
jgi:hypothetical protein